MAALLNRLSQVKINSITKKGWYPDGGNLYLQVTSPTAKSWAFRYKFNVREYRLGLGSYPAIDLKRARQVAGEYRTLLQSGENPKTVRQRKKFQLSKDGKSWTFEACAIAYMEIQRPSWSNAKHAQQWENTLANYAYPSIGDHKIDELGIDHIIACLEPIWATKTETAVRLRQRIEAVIDWAKAKGISEAENPARWKGLLDKVLPAPRRLSIPRHHPYMALSDVPAFYSWLCQKQSVTALSFRFLMLTAARNAEARRTQLSELDIENQTWSLPPDRMKPRIHHKVPLSVESLAVINQAKDYSDGYNLFSAQQGKAISEASLRKMLGSYIEYTNISHCVPHGFRSCFRIWAETQSNLGFAVLETAISHKRGNSVQAAYLDTDFLEERRELMTSWASFLTGNRSDL